jgi:hypothetical protein
MASLGKKLIEFARSRQGQQLIAQAKAQADKPENRRKIEDLRGRYGKKPR